MWRFVLGSVSQKKITEGPVRSAGRTEPPPATRGPGVPADRSGRSAQDLLWLRCSGGQHARGQLAVPVCLVTALDARMYTALAFLRLPGQTGTARSDTDESGRMTETLDALAAPLSARGLAVSSIITAGDPKQVLLDEAEHWEADALFVGARRAQPGQTVPPRQRIGRGGLRERTVRWKSSVRRNRRRPHGGAQHVREKKKKKKKGGG